MQNRPVDFIKFQSTDILGFTNYSWIVRASITHLTKHMDTTQGALFKHMNASAQHVYSSCINNCFTVNDCYLEIYFTQNSGHTLWDVLLQNKFKIITDEPSSVQSSL